MFNDCSSLTCINFLNFNTKNVEIFKNLFNGCGKLKSIDISGFKTSKVININSMFMDCESLTSIISRIIFEQNISPLCSKPVLRFAFGYPLSL